MGEGRQADTIQLNSTKQNKTHTYATCNVTPYIEHFTNNELTCKHVSHKSPLVN